MTGQILQRNQQCPPFTFSQAFNRMVVREFEEGYLNKTELGHERYPNLEANSTLKALKMAIICQVLKSHLLNNTVLCNSRFAAIALI